MEISIRLWGGITISGLTSISLEVQNDSTILDIKRKIQKLWGFPVADQRILLSGSPVDDKGTVAGYKLQPKSELVVVPRQSGGGGSGSSDSKQSTKGNSQGGSAGGSTGGSTKSSKTTLPK
ncbi:hypothetical protein FE257_010348 [Aspergillus nanangensis]|uniref:Ubiquitin-like domain-containing protein n=1 Tax=Aspergillus nanangensis TaxID=2582783 RepID=A0AAD4GTE5_ASPNN|nr:hypothetical protein FE257_010348 [Aspergillus nanangensis]